MERDLPQAIAEIEHDPEAAAAMGSAAYERYCRFFSLAAGGEALGRILDPVMAE
jgi:glycosyltransferase involved in cell wall biosynthesis